MTDPTGLSPEQHRRALVEYVGTDGVVEDLGESHLSIFRPAGPTLLVQFDTLHAIRNRLGGLPWSAGLARKRDYSTLTIAAHGATWFRDPTLHDYFDFLIDEGLFDDYDNVVFAGGGMGAYGAAAFSVAAPGASVFLAQPYATLDRDITPWEDRFRASRRLAFTGRYGNAARMIDAAARVFVVTDPTRPLDAMHAALFQGDHVTRLPAPHAGPDIWGQLEHLKILDRLVAGAAEGTLGAQRFFELWRTRHSDPVWLTRVLRKLDAQNRPWLTAIWAGNMLKQAENATARRRLNAALATLSAEDRPTPEGLEPQAPDRPERMLLAGE